MHLSESDVDKLAVQPRTRTRRAPLSILDKQDQPHQDLEEQLHEPHEELRDEAVQRQHPSARVRRASLRLPRLDRLARGEEGEPGNWGFEGFESRDGGGRE